jgi:hypothetical protein
MFVVGVDVLSIGCTRGSGFAFDQLRVKPSA